MGPSVRRLYEQVPSPITCASSQIIRLLRVRQFLPTFSYTLDSFASHMLEYSMGIVQHTKRTIASVLDPCLDCRARASTARASTRPSPCTRTPPDGPLAVLSPWPCFHSDCCCLDASTCQGCAWTDSSPLLEQRDGDRAGVGHRHRVALHLRDDAQGRVLLRHLRCRPASSRIATRMTRMDARLHAGMACFASC